MIAAGGVRNRTAPIHEISDHVQEPVQTRPPRLQLKRPHVMTSSRMPTRTRKASLAIQRLARSQPLPSAAIEEPRQKRNSTPTALHTAEARPTSACPKAATAEIYVLSKSDGFIRKNGGGGDSASGYKKRVQNDRHDPSCRRLTGCGKGLVAQPTLGCVLECKCCKFQHRQECLCY